MREDTKLLEDKTLKAQNIRLILMACMGNICSSPTGLSRLRLRTGRFI